MKPLNDLDDLIEKYSYEKIMQFFSAWNNGNGGRNTKNYLQPLFEKLTSKRIKIFFG